MRLDAVTAEIRPRSDWEAVDLGMAMVRRDFWRCFSVWWLAMIVPTVVMGWWLWDHPMLWFIGFWWCKPAGSRLVLFELSRRLFGERPLWRHALREIPRAWTRRFFFRFFWARLSPWLPMTLPVEDLEGLRGRAYRHRCSQITTRGQGAAVWIYLTADLAAAWFGLALIILGHLLMPQGQDSAWQVALESFDPSDPTSMPLLLMRSILVCLMLAVSLTDVFLTGSGFGLYLNNRTWIEGWDVELALKRLGRRLAKMVVVVMLASGVAGAGRVQAAAPRDAGQVVREVKADEAFKVHKVTDKVPTGSGVSWDWLRWLRIGGVGAWLGTLLEVTLIGLLVAAIGWVLWHNRHALRLGTRDGADVRARARVVMGMEVSPESLPDDVPSAVLALWRQGRHHDALGLLYRATISRVIEAGRVEIQESDTEGECLQRVSQAGAGAHPDYFRGLTRVWMRLAYAGMAPPAREVESLCDRWPFVERREP